MRWFINDTATASQQWRIKRHAIHDFWDWVASWARMAEMPSDITGNKSDDERFILPELKIIRHHAEASPVKGTDLFGSVDMSATKMHEVKRTTAGARAKQIADLVTSDSEPWMIWCDTDYEADAIRDLVPDIREVRGSHSSEHKESTLRSFSDGSIRVLLSKPSICGFGMNWQHCARTAFVGRSFSYETWFQAVRRFWRFGQTRDVEVHLIVAEGEDAIARVIDRKARDHADMRIAMAKAMSYATGRTVKNRTAYHPTHKAGVPQWMV